MTKERKNLNSREEIYMLRTGLLQAGLSAVVAEEVVPCIRVLFVFRTYGI